MNYNDDGITLDYEQLKTHTPSLDEKASTQPNSHFTTPQSHSKEFSTRSMRDSKPSNISSKEAMNAIVVLDDEPGSIEVKQEYTRAPHRVQNRSGPNNGRDNRHRKLEKNGSRPGPNLHPNQSRRRLTSFPKQEQEVIELIDDDDVAEIPQVKKVKIEANIELEEKPKEVIPMNTSVVNLNNVNNVGGKSRGKKGKKEEIKKKNIMPIQGDSTPNFLSNPIPSFSGKFQTDNMYIINQMFYFDPIKVSL